MKTLKQKPFVMASIELGDHESVSFDNGKCPTSFRIETSAPANFQDIVQDIFCIYVCRKP